ncbi:quinol monooxygenase YgiN [Sinomonas atrocyanea]|jgi:quinol monooxygenase YgiN|uniref:putative quinol monooxygenase n=1 Tax=Sinomonas atrocyanea TaxID=37927 RepID=UPI00277E8864|nr:putative quinol monooxygenase [Sinomonas atrocyanea]MDP9882871.1 quinol monooxygenase YgiN [Sinomonas atrocyanea]
MYFIVVKFETKPEYTEQFPEIVREFTESTRREPGNLFFEWSRSLENPAEYVLVEGFTDDGAAPHVQSEHFAKGLESMRPCLVKTPSIISRQVDGEGWGEMGELQIG